MYRRQVKKQHAFMMRHLRSIIRITSMDKMTNKEILERTGLPSMEDLLNRKNLRWTGHLLRMSPDRLPKQVLYCQLSHRKRGRPRLRFNDTIKINLKLRNIKIDSCANDPVWQTHLIYHQPINKHFYSLAKISFDMSTLRHIHAYATPTLGKCVL